MLFLNEDKQRARRHMPYSRQRSSWSGVPAILGPITGGLFIVGYRVGEWYGGAKLFSATSTGTMLLFLLFLKLDISQLHLFLLTVTPSSNYNLLTLLHSVISGNYSFHAEPVSGCNLCRGKQLPQG